MNPYTQDDLELVIDAALEAQERVNRVSDELEQARLNLEQAEVLLRYVKKRLGQQNIEAAVKELGGEIKGVRKQ